MCIFLRWRWHVVEFLRKWTNWTIHWQLVEFVATLSLSLIAWVAVFCVLSAYVAASCVLLWPYFIEKWCHGCFHVCFHQFRVAVCLFVIGSGKSVVATFFVPAIMFWVWQANNLNMTQSVGWICGNIALVILISGLAVFYSIVHLLRCFLSELLLGRGCLSFQAGCLLL